MGKLRPWCKRAKHTLIDRDIGVSDLAEAVGLTRPYTSAILNGRVWSESAVKKISSYLNIPDTDDEPVNEMSS